MAAFVHIDEYNGAGPETASTSTHSISSSNYVSTDAANAVAASNPITPNVGGAYQGSYAKFHKIHVDGFNGVTKVKNMKFWRVQGTPTGGDLHKMNCTISGYANKTYTTPTTALMTFYNVDTSEPATANVGINSVLTNEILTIATNSVSDFIWHQVQVSAATTAGAVLTLRYQWDEVS